MTRKLLATVFISFLLMGAAFQFGGLKLDITSQVTSVSPVILNTASTQIQRFTGSANQVVKLPDATTLRAGYFYYFSNEGSGTLTISNSSSTQIVQLPSGATTTQGAFLFLTSSATTGGPWTYGTLGGSGGSSSASDCYFYLTGGSGFGSTNTKIRIYTTEVTNSCSDGSVTYASNSTDGASFTINTAGTYCFGRKERHGSSDYVGFSRNSNQLTTNLDAITAANNLGGAETGADFMWHHCARLSPTGNGGSPDVIRPHSRAGQIPTGATDVFMYFTHTN